MLANMLIVHILREKEDSKSTSGFNVLATEWRVGSLTGIGEMGRKWCGRRWNFYMQRHWAWKAEETFKESYLVGKSFQGLEFKSENWTGFIGSGSLFLIETSEVVTVIQGDGVGLRKDEIPG